MSGLRILAVRLGAMGDIIHALPAVATLKHSFPHSHLAWAIDAKWAALLEGNPFLDELIVLEGKTTAGVWKLFRQLRRARFDLAVDFQGLVKSALVASAARADRIIGFHHLEVRERFAAVFYSHKTPISAVHVVDRNLALAAAAGASNVVASFALPPGRPEGELPGGPFVLANPLAGWAAKQWPLEHYSRLAERLKTMGLPLVLNGPPSADSLLRGIAGTLTYCSSLPGLIHATRRALAVVGIDSGPLHLAAALKKPGVAIFGPTDPARNGPYGNTIAVLRYHRANTTYKRRPEPDESMREIHPDAVFEALQPYIASRPSSAGSPA